MKQIFKTLLIFFLIIVFMGYNSASHKSSSSLIDEEAQFTNKYCDSVSLEESSKEQVMGWIIINLLSQYIHKPLRDYYGGDVPYWITTPTSQILQASYINEKSYFTLKFQVEPYLGAHNPIGLDDFTFKIDEVNDKITLERYEHIKSFKIPEHVKNQHLDLNLK
ncbi:DUF3888 domain-containing protein [Clostridium sp. 19966]|uniref:DUF3888 domain-containing protein n=1 Tax=Clostridium sp. 19966 TaxID=2768166 RepID=UPI0028E041D9|nr:DUF3888 domain-containing protein [Clostridium sp. 19966]MDT8719724.1 DUF3888 domain-containing protein [Clostridium sp. 19966]